MKAFGTTFVWATVLLISHAATAEVALPQKIPMDASGRALKDDRGKLLTYDTSPVTPRAESQTSQKTGVRSSQKSRELIRMQSTGTSPSYRQEWKTAVFGTGIGATGIWPIDADNDGDTEFVVGGGSGFGGNTVWSIVGYNAAKRAYDILYQSPPSYVQGNWSPSISALRVIEAANTKRIWIGFSDGSIQVVNALTRETVQTLAPSTGTINDFALADADNDSSIDVVAVTDSQTFLYNPDSLALRRTIAQGGRRIAIGNVDADAALELVFNTGRVIQANGATTTVQWNSPSAFGERIGLADIDADGRAELIGADAWYLIRAWDLDLESLKWSINADLDIGAFRLIDVANDATPEIVYGDGQWGEIHVVDAVTRAELWNIRNPEHGTTDVAVFDADGDGQREILWGAGWSSTGPDYLYVHDLATREFEWQSSDIVGPYSAVDIGDVDGDGQLEAVVASFESQSGYADGVVMVFNLRTNELEWASDGNTFGGHAWTGVHALKLVNVDADAQLEIVLGTDRLYDGALYVIDGLTHAMQNDAIYDSGSPLNVLDAADLAGDARPEIVVGNTVAHTGSPGVFVSVLDPLTDAVIWKSGAIASGFSSITDVHVADVGAPGIDILAVSSAVHAIRWSDRRLLKSSTTNYASATAGDVNVAAGNEVLAASNSGTVDVLNGDTLAVITTHTVCNAPINAIQMHATNRIIATCADRLIVYDLATRTVADATETGLSQLGMNGSLARAIDNNRSVVLTGGSEAVKFIDASANQLPTLAPATLSVHWRGTAGLQLSGADADGDTLRYEFVSLPALGVVKWTDAAAGTLQYAAHGTATGSDSLLVRVSDGAQYSQNQTVSISLTNTIPVAQTKNVSLHWRGAQAVALAGSDANGDPLTFKIDASPARGTVALSDAATGAAMFTPSGAFVGTDEFHYSVTDGASVATSAVQLTLTNAAPVASAAQYEISNGVTVHSRFGATDANGDPLSYSILQQPTRGTITFEAATGLFQYVPAANATGVDSVTFAINDGVAQAQAVVEFRYPAASSGGGSNGGGGSSSGGGGGGGAFDGLLLLLLAPLIGSARRTRRLS